MTTLTRLGAAWIATTVVFLGLDALYLTNIGAKLDAARIGEILAPNVNLPAAAAFYVLYTVGLVALGVAPTLTSRRWTEAAGRGALLGLFAYGTYDLTNQATLKVWDTGLTLTDMAWGTFVSACGAAAGAALAARLGRTADDRP